MTSKVRRISSVGSVSHATSHRSTALIHLVGFEGGKTFSGGSVVAGPRGDVKLRAPLWEEAIATVTLDTAELTRARVELPLLTDLQTMLPHLVRTIGKIQLKEPLL